MSSLPATASGGTAIGIPDHEDTVDWFANYSQQHALTVTQRPITDLDGWHRDERGNLVHRSGRFFSLRAVRTMDQDRSDVAFSQPILLQRDVGILGILRTFFDGVAHYLMQAKIEPGNPGTVQLSPTVQATRSNYTAAHRGAAVPYLEHFHPLPSGRALVDSLQGEHGSVFYRKHNRNMIVEVSNDIEVLHGFRWMRLEEIAELFRVAHVVNMDSRSVLSLLPPLDDVGPALHEDEDVRSWMTRQRAADLYVSEVVDLDRLEAAVGSRQTNGVFECPGAPFRVLGVEVAGGGREVRSWHQPMVELRGSRTETLASARFHGQPHLLVRAARHHGSAQGIELHPTTSDVDGESDPWALSPSLEHAHTIGASIRGHEEVLYDTQLSEEGGRFYHATSDYRLVRQSGASVEEPGPEYRWVTPRQLHDLAHHGGHVSVQARTLLAAIATEAVRL